MHIDVAGSQYEGAIQGGLPQLRKYKLSGCFRKIFFIFGVVHVILDAGVRSKCTVKTCHTLAIQENISWDLCPIDKFYYFVAQLSQKPFTFPLLGCDQGREEKVHVGRARLFWGTCIPKEHWPLEAVLSHIHSVNDAFLKRKEYFLL